MRKTIIILFALLPFLLNAQNVGINENGSAPFTGAILDISSDDKGILIPRLETSAVLAPAEGMLVYQPSDQSFYYFKSSAWEKIAVGSSSGASFETTSGNLIRSAGANIDSEDLIVGRSTTPGFTNISDKFIWYDQSSGAFRGGKLTDSQVWAPINIGNNSFAYGENVMADGPNSIALGQDLAVASSSTGFAMGLQDTVVASLGSGALGYQNQVGGTKGNIALGANNIITSDASEGAVAIGMNSGVSGDKGAVALGYLTSVTGNEGSVGIGKNILNTKDGAVIVGRNNAWSNYTSDLAFAVGIGSTPYDPANPRDDGMVIRGNGYTGFGVNFPQDAFQIKTKAFTPNEGLVVTGDTANLNVHFFLHNRNVGGKQWGLLSTGGNSPFGQGKFIIRDVNLGRETLTIDSIGNLGLRTTDPMDDLEINIRENDEFGGISVQGGLSTKEAHLTLDASSNAGRPYVLASTGTGADVNADKFIIKDVLAGEERMIINELGNLGIGKNSSIYKLGLKTQAEINDGIQMEGDIATKHVQMRFENNANNGHHYNLFATGGNSFFGDGKFIIRDVTETEDRLIIEPDGNIGIGKLNPEERMHVKGAIVVDTAFTNTPGTIQFKNNEFRGYDGTAWVTFGNGNSNVGTTLMDADGDTEINVEDTPDIDVIRLKLNNTLSFGYGRSAGNSARMSFVNNGNNTLITNKTDQLNTNLNNVLIGHNTALSHSSSMNNVYIGVGAARNAISNSDVAIGYNALQNSTNESPGHIAIGFSAGKNLGNSLHSLIGIGYEAAKNATRAGIFIGNSAGISNQAVDNIIIGDFAGSSNITGTSNVLIGDISGLNLTSGIRNTLLGANSGSNLTNGDLNTCLGSFSGTALSSGEENTCLGSNSGSLLTAGNGNTFIGFGTEGSNGLDDYAIAIGHSAKLRGDHTTTIGTTTMTSIGGYRAWSLLSDGRFKKNVQSNVPGLEFIQQLNPVTYNIKVNELNEFIYGKEKFAANNKMQKAIAKKEGIVESGFIAQEVEAAAKALNYDFDGVEVPENETQTYRLSYSQFVVPLVKAVQEQQEQIEALKAEIELLKKNKK